MQGILAASGRSLYSWMVSLETGVKHSGMKAAFLGEREREPLHLWISWRLARALTPGWTGPTHSPFQTSSCWTDRQQRWRQTRVNATVCVSKAWWTHADICQVKTQKTSAGIKFLFIILVGLFLIKLNLVSSMVHFLLTWSQSRLKWSCVELLTVHLNFDYA